MYEEIKQLKSYCDETGFVEFGFTDIEDIDFCQCSLEIAKRFVKRNKDKLNIKE